MPLNFKALLSDIEGTTSSISFVKNTLFPFAAEHAGDFIRKNYDCTQKAIENLIRTSNECALYDLEVAKIEPTDEDEVSISKLIRNIHHWIRHDKKLTSLKTLQGMIWEDGYRNGQLKADVYRDVPRAFEKLNDGGVAIYIYSSGSIQAQQLLFAHTNHGDLTKYISDYFDTNIGPKIEAGSYQKIAAKIGILPSEIFFLTDVEKEAIAADLAGIQVRLVLREGNVPISENSLEKFQTLESFDELFE